MKNVWCQGYRFCLQVITLIECWVRPLFDLGLRIYLWQVFFRAGWLKLSDWSGTLDLFDYFYKVPVLPPHLAAVMGTAGEVGLSTLLLFGFCGRFAAAGLFVTNLMAAISFPDIPELGLKDHYLWGALLLVLAFHGSGRLSLDHWFNQKLGNSRS
ncbi:MULTISPECIES: DoxX family protein [unclassified Paludibacterium]|uniref:DoxX family protein n=1 Tax=unclassified Paludibacterium TaxID=2618429 RepID=UPI001C051F82|nr:DoxX family protein [Paludibacterium sp. B53371]BEV72467.1 DoxX family protein [Paludibacterium sp. THUN1379]